MNWLLRSALGSLGCSLLACGGAPPAETPHKATVQVSEGPVAAADTPERVPSRCVMRKGACMPPVKWAERLCQTGVFQDLALYMFQDGTPWTRFYMRTGLNAVNGWGPTVSENLVSHEEVIPINYRRVSESFQVEGSQGTYDVLRWNGSCVTLDVGEVTRDEPSRPRNSRVEWKEMSEDMQSALLKDEEIESVFAARRKECKGASIGEVTAQCEVLDKKLVEVIANYVRETSGLPQPTEYP